MYICLFVCLFVHVYMYMYMYACICVYAGYVGMRACPFNYRECPITVGALLSASKAEYPPTFYTVIRIHFWLIVHYCIHVR